MKDVRTFTFALAVVAVMLAWPIPPRRNRDAQMATSPRPRRTALNADRFPVCTEDRAQAAPQVRWEERWGAIVMDAASGMTGIGGSQPTEEAAIQAATAMCQRKGGKNCRVDITYSNQCGALAWGSSHAVSARGRTLEIASKFAIDACENDRQEVRGLFSDCSLPVRAQ